MRNLIRRWRARWARGQDRKALMRAIDIACERCEIWGQARRADGLRAIRELERLSGRPFDPRDRVHLHIIRGRGPKVGRVWRDQLAVSPRAQPEAAVIPIEQGKRQRRARG